MKRLELLVNLFVGRELVVVDPPPRDAPHRLAAGLAEIAHAPLIQQPGRFVRDTFTQCRTAHDLKCRMHRRAAAEADLAIRGVLISNPRTFILPDDSAACPGIAMVEWPRQSGMLPGVAFRQQVQERSVRLRKPTLGQLRRTLPDIAATVDRDVIPQHAATGGTTRTAGRPRRGGTRTSDASTDRPRRRRGRFPPDTREPRTPPGFPPRGIFRRGIRRSQPKHPRPAAAPPGNAPATRRPPRQS